MRIFVVFFLALFGTSVSSAEFFILPGTKTLLVLGETKGADVAVIKQHLEDDAIDGLILKGPGGSLSAGYAIADLVADYKLSTTVSANTDCASACSLIFSAGNVRIMESGSRLGFHLPFLDVSNYEITEGYCRQLMTTEGVMASPSNNIGPECLMLTYQQGLKDIQKLSRILARDRISSKVLDLVIDTPSGDMRWVSVAEATEYGLTSNGDNKTAEEEAKEALKIVQRRLIQALAEKLAMQHSLTANAKAVDEKNAALQAQISLRDEEITEVQARLTAALARKLVAEHSLNIAARNEDEVRKQLTAALAAKLQSEQTSHDLKERLTATLAMIQAADDELGSTAITDKKLRKQFTAVLAAKLQSEQTSRDLLSATEQQALLLKNAQNTLSKERVTSAAAQRQTKLLKLQVARLRTQLKELSGLLSLAERREKEAQVQSQSLGSDLNKALARAVAQERRRRVLEEQERKRLEAETKDLAQYRSEFFGRLRDLLGTQEGVRIEGDRFVFSSEVLFPPGGAQLSPLGEVEITKIATILRGIADEIPPEIDWVIRVDGHTDNVPLSGLGKFSDNWELSQGRALSVVKYMANVLAIPPSRLAANGFGQYQPINRADTPKARAQNRRIELKFTEK